MTATNYTSIMDQSLICVPVCIPAHQPPTYSRIQRSCWHHEPADFMRDSLWQHQRLPANGLRPPGREGAGQECHPAHKPHHAAVPRRQGHRQAQPQLPGKHPRKTRGLRLAPQIMIVKMFGGWGMGGGGLDGWKEEGCDSKSGLKSIMV